MIVILVFGKHEMLQISYPSLLITARNPSPMDPNVPSMFPVDLVPYNAQSNASTVVSSKKRLWKFKCSICIHLSSVTVASKKYKKMQKYEEKQETRKRRKCEMI